MAALKELTARLLCALGVPMIARWRRSNRLAILMFHGVEREPMSPPCDWMSDTVTLRRDLEYVRRHFNVLPLAEALERLGDGTLPNRAAAVTFDDGTANLLTHAAPVLRELGVPAAVFLATGAMGTRELLWVDWLWYAFTHTTLSEIDLRALGLGKCSLRGDAERLNTRDTVLQLLKELPDDQRLIHVDSLVAALGKDFDAGENPFRLLSWEEATSLASDGLVTLYPHTVTHPILSRCDDTKVDYEISASCRAIELNTGRAPDVFAYPNGGVDDFDERARAALRRNGIRWALSTSNGFATRDSDPLALPRMGFASNQSYAVFRLKISGFAPRLPRTDAAKITRAEVGSDVSA